MMRTANLLGVVFVAYLACLPDSARTAVGAAAPQPRVEPPTPDAPVPPPPPPRVARLDDTGAGSPVLLARTGDILLAYVADTDDARVRVFDASRLQELVSFDPGGAPAQLAMADDGMLYASLRDKNEVVAIAGIGSQGSKMRVVARAPTAAEPIGLALTPDGATLLVTSGWGHALTALATQALTLRFERSVGREPRAVVTSDDGKRAFVSHAIGSDVDVVDLPDGKLRGRASMKATQSLQEGRFSAGEFHLGNSQGFAIARSTVPAGRIFVPHARVRPDFVASMEEEERSGYGSANFGPTEQFSVAVIDEDTGKPLKQSIETEAGTECILPRAATPTKDGELLVACVGTNEVKSFDAGAVNPHEALVRSWKVPAGPTGIAVDEAGARALVWSEIGHAITWVALASERSLVLSSENIARRVPVSPELQRGRELFHTADERISQDGRACASCHPDGRDDGLVWATPNGPRNPPMLAGRVDRSAPYGWLGESEDVPAHLAKTFGRLGGKGLPKDDVAALVAYVHSIPAPVATPRQGEALALAQEGRHLYDSEAVGCASCHGDDGVVPDTLTHNVKSWAQGDRHGTFDTPSLRSLAGTAPYFHDGRYATLGALLAGTKTTMGHTKQLTDHERLALETYLETL